MIHLGATFPVQVGLGWRVGARAPVSSGATVATLLLLLVLLLLTLAPGTTSPPAFTAYVALSALLFGARPGWIAWRWWRHNARLGPPRIILDTDAISVIADGYSTRVRWADVDWAGAMTGVPPRPGTLTLVARPKPDAPTPPPGYRRPRRWYEPQPRWYAHLGVVSLFDLALLAADPSEVAAAVDRFSGGKWRGERPPSPLGSGGLSR